jgi:hypothetical protein
MSVGGKIPGQTGAGGDWVRVGDFGSGGGPGGTGPAGRGGRRAAGGRAGGPGPGRAGPGRAGAAARAH